MEAEQQALEEELGALVVPQRRAPHHLSTFLGWGWKSATKRLRRQ